MCSVWLVALVLSTVGALAAFAVARALGVPARLLLGVGSRAWPRAGGPATVEIRWLPFWSTAEIGPGGPPARALVPRLVAPVAVMVAPFTFAVAVLLAHGAPDATAPLVVEVSPSSAAEEGGLRSGDVVLDVEGTPTPRIDAVAREVDGRAGQPTAITVLRAGERLALTATPRDVDGHGRLGITARPAPLRAIGPFEAARIVTELVALQLGAMAELIVRHELHALRGPVGMSREMAGRIETPLAPILIALAAAWTAFSPLIAIGVLIDQLLRWRRARKA